MTCDWPVRDELILVLYEEAVKPAFPKALYDTVLDLISIDVRVDKIIIRADLNGVIWIYLAGKDISNKFDLLGVRAIPELVRYLRELAESA